MNFRILTLILASLIGIAISKADAPAGYYSSLNGKADANLKTALFNLINKHTEVSSYSALPSYFRQTDVRPGTDYWWDMYSNMSVATNITFGTYMNREHSLPKSWWGGDTDIPAYVDLFHLYPAEAKANVAKSNYPLGELIAGGKVTFDNGVSQVGTGVNSGGASYVFEPADEYKGDFARTYFYMVTAYQNMDWVTTWQVKNGTYPSLQQWAIDLLLKWHRNDPVSQKEINRNEAVYKIQNNRNPYIDNPELAEYIWGNKKGQAYSSTSTITPAEATLITPVNGMYIDFNEVAVNHPGTAQLIFRGSNVSGTFELGISGLNKSLFKLSTSTVAGSLANSTSGTYVTITYTPNAIGSHTAQVNISDGCLPLGETYKVYLRGQALAEPTLSTLTATAAENVSDTAYTARWDAPPANEVVDYYLVTVKRYKGSNVTTFELPAETDSLNIDGLNQGDYDTYAVQSVRLGIKSPISNFVTVKATASISDIAIDQQPLTIESQPGFIRFRCSEPITNVTVYDLAGRIVTQLPIVNDYQELPLPRGIYFVSAPSHCRPLRTIVY